MSAKSLKTDIGVIQPMLRKLSLSGSMFGPDTTNTKFIFCGQCLDEIETMATVEAYCKQCQEVICSIGCLKQHSRNRLTKSHGYLFEQELRDFLSRDDQLSCLLDMDEEEEKSKKKLTLTASLRFEFNIRSNKDKEICSIHSTVVLANGKLVLADLKNNNLKLYDPRARACVSVLNMPSGPRDICLSKRRNYEMYAIESGIHGIHLIDIENDLQIADTLPVTGECFGIADWKRGIAVSMSTSSSSVGEYLIALLDYEGVVRKRITPKRYTGLELVLPWYLTSSFDGQRILISDYGNHSVTCVDVDGGVLFVYKDADLVRPVSMAIGLNNDVFIVGQRSHNIHHLTDMGDKRGVVYSENAMDFPGGISYDDENDQFYLQGTGWSDVMQVFKFGLAVK